MRTLLISVAISLVIGFIIGYAFHSNYICPDMNKAIIKQMKEDADKVAKIKKKAEIRYVEVEKVKTVIRNVKDTTGCNRVPSPELRDILLDSLRAERPLTD